MSKIAEFREQLAKRTRMKFGKWHRIDLHNHSPSSFDYKGSGTNVAADTAASVKKNDLSVVMFTDHGVLPDSGFLSEVSRQSGRLILSGSELNVFVDAFDLPEAKIGKQLFYHLLVGFDPENSQRPDYWLSEIYRRCATEERVIGGGTIRGITSPPEHIRTILADANAILIPAHLHVDHDLSKSRSIDSIYSDATFLKHARDVFTALEVVDKKTAEYFDGEHKETLGIRKACVRSSDSHEPGAVGWRFSYAEMESPSFAELKAALELPFRTAIDRPTEPEAYVVGMNIRGAFFTDLWVAISPHCNTLIGVKGSGKTSVLECLRFALGAEVPSTRLESVRSHLSAILGPAGTVEVLMRRPDGAEVLVSRSLSDAAYVLTFEDDHQERLTGPEGLHFPVQILGWHEIEQAATDRNVRRVYLDAIAGRTKVRSLEQEARTIAGRITERHGQCSQSYVLYRERHREVERLEELRRGLKALEDASLIDLRDRYLRATDQRDILRAIIERLGTAPERARHLVTEGIVPKADFIIPEKESPIAAKVAKSLQLLAEFAGTLDGFGGAIHDSFEELLTRLRAEQDQVDIAYKEFLGQYTVELDKLTPEQQRLLEKHREVLEETRQLAALRADRDTLKEQTSQQLAQLTQLCEELAAKLDERTELRRRAVEHLNSEITAFDVRLEILAQQTASEFTQLSGQYAQGAAALGQIRQRVPERLSHLCLGRAYSELSSSWNLDYGRLLFENAELGRFLGVFEDDDLSILLRVGKAGEEYSPVEQLSAGQRCTAIFPILLLLDEGPLIIDQPEDNLDNRHIARSIAPSLLGDKLRRQMVFTSHNANLVVLSDAESVVLFESDGSKGRIEEQGFFATRISPIARHIMDVLDGGEQALHLRALKYGLGQT